MSQVSVYAGKRRHFHGRKEDPDGAATGKAGYYAPVSHSEGL